MNLFGPPEGKETLLRYLTKYMPQFIISSIGGFVYNTTIVLGPIIMGKLIDNAGGGPGQQVLLSALYFIGITAFFQFARYVKRWYMRDQFNRVACDLRQTFIERTLGRNLQDLEKETVGDLMARTVGDITEVVGTVMVTLNEGWDTWLLMISYFITLVIQDWRITLMASVMVPITIIIAQTVRHVLFRYSMSVRKATSTSNSGLQRYLEGIAVLRLFGREESEAEGLKQTYKEQTGYRIKEMLLQQVLLPVYSLIAGLGVVIVIAFAGQKVVSGEWTVGTFNAYFVMFVALSTRTRVAARVFNRWHGARAAWTRVKGKMQLTDERKEKTGITLNECSKLEIINLSYRYNENKVLTGINFEAEKGQLIGITGSVGSGKTSLALALTGMYPYEGSIRLDGVELSDIDPSSRSKLIAYTGHEQFLFSLSIKENVMFTSKEDDETRLHEALEASALNNDLNRFTKGLDTKVGEKGVRVSGGQRQRIALARAVYSGSDILILDDPFSAVDIATEREIIDHLKTAHKEKIVLLFTHRLTSFVYADKVIVLDGGRISERGTHEELMKKGDVYSEIFSAQRFMEVEA
ncbi:ABC transporter ATP-binding protein [Candidatus Bathyarchaeota archaeon]|nr:ABC transporter ATP-binding protein [Candidatus Bathyarchaeota archaeon]